MHLVYQIHTQPTFIRKFILYFTKDVDLEYMQISGGFFPNGVVSSMNICQEFFAGVNCMYWVLYLTLLVGGIVRPSSPYIILSLTWPPEYNALGRILMSFVACIYFMVCYLHVAAMFFSFVFTWFRVTVLTLKSLGWVETFRTILMLKLGNGLCGYLLNLKFFLLNCNGISVSKPNCSDIPLQLQTQDAMRIYNPPYFGP